MNSKKVMLLFPNFKWADWSVKTNWDLHPYNIGILASMIEKEYDVSILDANEDNLSQEEFSEIIKNQKPDILGFSILTSEYGPAGDIAAKLAKQANPEIKVVVGGVHSITCKPEDILKNQDIDYVVIGEGEYTFKKLCNHLFSNQSLPEKGIAYREGTEIINKGRSDFIEDLNALPYPAYHKFDFLKYANKTERKDIGSAREFPYVRMMTSRGCPYNCCFCEVKNISGRKPRLRSVEHILGEIELLIKNYGIRTIIFDDDNILVDRERAKRLFEEMIKRNYNLTWNSPAMTVFKLDEEIIKLMKDSGCQCLNIAIESGNARVLKEIIHKPLELEETKKTIELIKKYNIDLVANFIIGFPGETWDEIRETIKFAEDIDIDYVKIFIATPFPNTELYEIAKQGNYLREGFSFNKHLWTDGWIDTAEFRHQDLKILRAYEWDRINFSKPEKRKKIARMMNITEEELNNIRKNTLERANP